MRPDIPGKSAVRREIELKIYTGSIHRGLDEPGSEHRRLYEAIDEATAGTPVTITRYGKTLRLVQEQPSDGPMVKVFSWRWKSQPPMEEIGQFVSEIFARGRAFHMREYIPGDDCYWWIVSDYPVDDDEAERLYEAM